MGIVGQIGERHTYAPVRRIEAAAVEQHDGVIFGQLVDEVERMDVLLQPRHHLFADILAQPDLETDRAIRRTLNSD